MPPNTCGVLLTFTMSVMVVNASEKMFSGYHFLDNQLEARFGPDNGYATYDTGDCIVLYCISRRETTTNRFTNLVILY